MNCYYHSKREAVRPVTLHERYAWGLAIVQPVNTDLFYKKTLLQDLCETSLEKGKDTGKPWITEKQSSINDQQVVKALCCAIIEENSSSPEPEELGPNISSVITNENLEKLNQPQITFSKWDMMCFGRLILKRGLLDKGKRLFAGKILFPQKRLILLTLGPRLYLANPVTHNVMEEIPWGPQLHVKLINCKIFLIQTFNKRYYFGHSKDTALNWCVIIEKVHRAYHGYQDVSSLQNFKKI